jgi:RNA polymerase sigma factor (TIGR02999 family)
MSEAGTVTRLLQRVDQGDRDAEAALYELVKDELKKIALTALEKWQMEEERNEDTLGDEVFMRLVREAQTTWEHRRKFYGYAVRKTQDILTDMIRARLAQRRGGGWSRVEQDPDQFAEPGTLSPKELGLWLDVGRALDRLAEKYPEAATVCRMKYFWRSDFGDIARKLDLDMKAVRQKWEFARAFLSRELKDYRDDF